MLSGIVRNLRTVRATAIVPRQNLARTQVMGVKKMIGKPHPKAVYDSATGEPIINSKKLEKQFRWRPEQIEHLRKIMIRIKRTAERTVAEGDRAAEMQKMLNQYISGLWGTRLKAMRAYSKYLRTRRAKKRAFTKLARKFKFWNEVEDMREQKVIRDKERALREANGEQYSFRKFLRWWKESQRKPFVIHDEETFAKMLEEDKMKNFVRGPSSVRRKLHNRMSYETRFRLEVGEPLMYHLKRKAHLTKMIREREQAIKEKKLAEELAERRAVASARKAEKRAERKAYWDKVLGEWHLEQARLADLKRKYFLARQEVYDKARQEWLTALNEDVDLWKETPDECKYMRFVFGEGVKFPFNNTPYH
eukprot:TRINITY_DN1952_c0_g1_i1.p1 TRINITY_DN1952_c0_g1~~TRINITY_DN1952_c0_g1_i1.p1  ORF type:complete len:363 (-),score=94.82 TRINITY_DN1952_c0_g1_i1:44-1132(-)